MEPGNEAGAEGTHNESFSSTIDRHLVRTDDRGSRPGDITVGAPARADEGELNASDAVAIRVAMQDAGLSVSVQDRLIAKLDAGERLDSELDTAIPVESETSRTNLGQLTTATFADGSVRTTQEIASAPGVPSTRLLRLHPSLECNLLHCTLIYTKADTKAMSSATTATLTAALTAACGPAAWACALAIGIVSDTVKRAAAQGKCFGAQRLTTAAPVYPVIVTCRR